MRRLLYIPILHSEQDMGGLATTLSHQSIALVGKERWAEHQAVVLLFWQRVGEYLLSLEPANIRIYQDGLAVEGKTGLRVVEEAARRGSPNYLLLQQLVQGGALLRKTEDIALLSQELQSVLSAVEIMEIGRTGRGLYRGLRSSLMEARDRFIAKTINGSLQEGEVGVLFLGAYHGVLPYLASDVEVQHIREREKVLSYFLALFSEADQGSLRTSARFLTSPIIA